MILNIFKPKFSWISSVTGKSEALFSLHQKMSWFYGQREGRELYQDMLNTQEETAPPKESVRHLMPKYICELKPKSILEVGCANGRLYRQLRSYGYIGAYSGIEVADYLIQQNMQQHPEATWKCTSAYKIPFPNSSFEVCLSLYVLEHLVYPERALREMLRVIKPGGHLVLVFPDFVESGRFSSQLLGFSPIGTASAKIRRGKLIDALVSLYQSRIVLPRVLKSAVDKLGPFPINTRPICLSYPSVMGADVDAIYIASKKEVHDWAISNGYDVKYPCGTKGEFAEQAFMSITMKNEH
ncbi:Methyltransferase domain family [Coleofasciculus chthonoplastes PCC 7420]|uniref:Methyltransferase domain family n=1 Tax=Coleofasciculus chthonoplastes PCC 7420 TaxID=118168 RepID=B4VS40_9CYAN|nr:class I SAM-dependent methyltransferase [Coleofasciculus chthonoplastes]EDX75233.1 Methyltransferase domain family [Coleofasciculus chthonoplastes PCC 7420]